jgi:hypothetical protein
MVNWGNDRFAEGRALRPSAMKPSPRLERMLSRYDVDLVHLRPPPPTRRVVAATAAAVVVSLALAAALVALGERLFPSTRGFSHFRVLDYGSLTLLGVLAACAAWPIVVRVVRRARPLYRRLAVLVSVVLVLPDAYLLASGESARAVGVLLAMHLGIALCTYNLVVRIAPAPDAAPGVGEVSAEETGEPVDPPRWWFVSLGTAACLELAVGLVALLAVPYGRPSEVIVHGKGAAVYLVHGALGVALGLGALALVPACRRATKALRAAALAGVIGVGVGALGGLLVADKPARIAGVGLMLVGSVVAATAYFMPLLSEQPQPVELDEAPPGVPAPH